MSPNDDVTRVGFGAVIPRYGVEYSDAREQALRNEKLGFDSIWLTDHLQPPGIDGPVLETWTLLTALAMETERIRLGTMTICYSYRHPSVLAKMASTLDRISNGRLILAIGTGANSQVDENQALGIPYPRAPIRIEQLKEYVQVIKRLWGEGIADFHGKYYTLDGAKKNSPVLQKPTIPVWIGVRGPKMLRAVAEMGDSWNYHGHSAEEYAEATSIVNSRCRELGRQENSLQSSVYGGIAIAKSEEELQEGIRKAASQRKIPEKDFFRKSYTVIYGTPAQCIERVEKLIKLGSSYFIFRDFDVKGSNIALFGKEVLPHFQDNQI